MFGERISWQYTCSILAGIYIYGRSVSKNSTDVFPETSGDSLF